MTALTLVKRHAVLGKSKIKFKAYSTCLKGDVNDGRGCGIFPMCTSAHVKYDILTCGGSRVPHPQCRVTWWKIAQDMWEVCGISVSVTTDDDVIPLGSVLSAFSKGLKCRQVAKHNSDERGCYYSFDTANDGERVRLSGRDTKCMCTFQSNFLLHCRAVGLVTRFDFYQFVPAIFQPSLQIHSRPTCLHN